MHDPEVLTQPSRDAAALGPRCPAPSPHGPRLLEAVVVGLDAPGPRVPHCITHPVHRGVPSGLPRGSGQGASREGLIHAAQGGVEACGSGEVYALTVIPRKPERGGTYNIALVELEEGPRMMTRIVGIDPEAIQIGMRVKAKIVQPDFGSMKDGDQNLVVFEPDVEQANG